MVLCRTLARNEHELSIEITPFENFYGICYHLDCPIQTYQKVVFALREKIEPLVELLTKKETKFC